MEVKNNHTNPRVHLVRDLRGEPIQFALIVLVLAELESEVRHEALVATRCDVEHLLDRGSSAVLARGDDAVRDPHVAVLNACEADLGHFGFDSARHDLDT